MLHDPRIQDHGDGGDFDGRRLGQNDGSIRNSRNDGDHQELLQFRAGHDQDSLGGDDSGFCSPPLWKNSPSPSHPLLSHHVNTALCLSPKARLLAITRGQRELMEMVRSLPESSYELSLQDLVEHHKMETMEVHKQKETLVDKTLDGSKQRRVVKAVRRQESKRSVGRSGSFEMENRGLFLKMGFPFSVKSKKKNNSSFGSNGKVSPKPERIKNNSGGGELDSWKKKFTGSSDSDSSRTSDNSGSRSSSSSSSSSRRKKKAPLKGCWPLFQSRSSKTTVV